VARAHWIAFGGVREGGGRESGSIIIGAAGYSNRLAGNYGTGGICRGR